MGEDGLTSSENASRRLRVALLALHFAEYGFKLAVALQSRHADVLLVTYENNAGDELGAGWRTRAQAAGVQVLSLPRPGGPSGPWQVIRNARQLAGTLKTFGAELLHLQEVLRDELVLVHFFSVRRLPIVLTVHDVHPHPGADAARLKYSRRAFYRWYLRHHSQRAITHGKILMRSLAEAEPQLQGAIDVIPHGPLGGPMTETPLPSQPVRLLFFGRIEAYKGLRYFVAAVKRLQAQGLHAVGVVAGRGTELATYRAEMDAAGCFEIHDRYIPAEEIAALFNGSTAIVLPYIEGTQSGVAAMALGFGRPVVATPVGSIPELVQDGVNGLLVPVGDAEALAKAVLDVGIDGLERLASGARLLAQGSLSWPSIAALTAGSYRRVMRLNADVPASDGT